MGFFGNKKKRLSKGGIDERTIMRRFFVEKIDAGSKTMAIRGAEARHIFSVLRMEPGDRLILFDGRGLRFQARIISAGRKEVMVALEKPLEPPPPVAGQHHSLPGPSQGQGNG